MPAPRERPGGRPPIWLAAAGIYLLVAAVYLLSGPGRIDIVDGQVRFEAARGLLAEGRPVLRDPHLQRFGSRGPDGRVYSRYGPAASIAGLPLVWLGGGGGDVAMFLFSHTSALFGAASAALLFLFYLELGLGAGAAVSWALVAAFASLVWPASTSTFDQSQHAFLLLLALFLAFRAGRRDSPMLAASGGLAAGLLVTYQEPFVLLLPMVAVAALGGDGGRRRARGWSFLAATAAGLLLWMGWNALCFGDPFLPAKLRPALSGHPAVGGNLLVGLAGLMVSPGKSVLLYSPTVVLGAVGFRSLLRRERQLGSAIALASAVFVLFVASLSFWHGDWSWGPRYLVVLLPLWALPAPFALRSAPWRAVAAALVSAGVASQLLGLAVVHERFFDERGLGAFFWAEDRGFYFRESAIVARPAEIVDLLTGDRAERAGSFAPSPYPGSTTYFIANLSGTGEGPEALSDYQVYHLPRPWPFWMRWLERHGGRPPVDPAVWSAALVAVALAGLVAILVGLSLGRPPRGERLAVPDL